MANIKNIFSKLFKKKADADSDESSSGSTSGDEGGDQNFISNIQDSSQKSETKLTEKELELIIALNKNNGLKKSFLLSNIWKHNSDLDSHAFETNLHRLRKKIYNTFKDKNFIIEKNSLYFLKN